jgi:hypothetical protein
VAITYLDDTPLPDLTPEDLADLTMTKLQQTKEQYREQWHHHAMIAAYLLLTEPVELMIPTARENAIEVRRLETSLRVIRDELNGRAAAEHIDADLRKAVGL